MKRWTPKWDHFRRTSFWGTGRGVEDVFEVAAASFVQRQQVRALGQVGNLELGRQEVLEDEGPLRVPLDHPHRFDLLDRVPRQDAVKFFHLMKK